MLKRIKIFGLNGRKLAREKFTWIKIAEDLEIIYREAKAN